MDETFCKIISVLIVIEASLPIFKNSKIWIQAICFGLIFLSRTCVKSGIDGTQKVLRITASTINLWLSVILVIQSTAQNSFITTTPIMIMGFLSILFTMMLKRTKFSSLKILKKNIFKLENPFDTMEYLETLVVFYRRSLKGKEEAIIDLKRIVERNFYRNDLDQGVPLNYENLSPDHQDLKFLRESLISIYLKTLSR